MPKKQQSPNYEKYWKYSGGFIREGFPFNEGFPKPPYDRATAKFELLLRTGERCTARIDNSRQYRSEGLEWMALTATNIFQEGSNIGRQVVVAWKEL